MGRWKQPGVKIDVAISLYVVCSCVLFNKNHDLRSMSSLYSWRLSLRVSISPGERMAFPLSGGRFDGWISMTWVICAVGVAATASMEASSYGLYLGGVNWIPWVVNMSEVQCMECGEPLCDLIRARGGVGEYLSSFVVDF